MKVAIHQPEHLPWLGFFDKALKADVFVLLDGVQFRKNYFQNRNKIRTHDGWTWITMPVCRPALAPINEVLIDTNSRSLRKNIQSIRQSYSGSPYFNEYYSAIERTLLAPYTKLVEINIEFIRLAWDVLEIKVPVVVASTLGVSPEGGGTRVTLEISRALGAGTYLSGISGRDYLDVSLFEEAGIEVQYQRFFHPVYSQRYEPFVPCMSFIDLIFNHGPRSAEIVRGIGVQKLETMFE